MLGDRLIRFQKNYLMRIKTGFIGMQKLVHKFLMVRHPTYRWCKVRARQRILYGKQTDVELAIEPSRIEISRVRDGVWIDYGAIRHGIVTKLAGHQLSAKHPAHNAE